MNSGRFVWISDEERGAIAGCSGWGEDQLNDVIERWDAAPADPAEAIAQMLHRNNEHPDRGMRDTSHIAWADLKPWMREAWRSEAADYLRALGLPDA